MLRKWRPRSRNRNWQYRCTKKGKLSFGKAREIAEMKVGAFQQLLGSRDIPVNYDVESYEEDLATLKEMGRL
jgi:predicted HTH domain antitoxin